MINKEIKKGDKIWIYAASMDYKFFLTVKSVKKEKTLVSVVVETKNYFTGRLYEIKMYGHASSSLLSGFNSRIGGRDMCYTCDYSLIEEKTARYNIDEKYIKAGQALLKFAQFFK